AEDGIRDRNVTGVQTCALPISPRPRKVTMANPSPPATKTDTARMRAAVWTPETSPPEESDSSSVSSTPPSAGGSGGTSLNAGRSLTSIRNTGPEGADAAVGAPITAIDTQSAPITAMGRRYIDAFRRWARENHKNTLPLS